MLAEQPWIDKRVESTCMEGLRQPRSATSAGVTTSAFREVCSQSHIARNGLVTPSFLEDVTNYQDVTKYVEDAYPQPS